MAILLFEDEYASRLSPLTLTRPAFAVSCGGVRLVELLSELDPRPACVVRPHLRDLVDAGEADKASSPLLLVNARLVPSTGSLNQLKSILAAGRPGIVRCGQHIAAALIPDGSRPPAKTDAGAMTSYLEKLQLPALDAPLELVEYPHDVLRHHLAVFGANLERRIASNNYRQIRDGVFAADGVALAEHVVTDSRKGPIVLGQGVTVGPFSFLRGPLQIDREARINEHSAIKDGTSIGRMSRVGGEVEASIIETYSNKQHHGYLGHSYVGSWVNLGAGTTNSDLKNTYGEVAVEYGGRKTPTGIQFVGCFIGDYTKTAINSAIFTGKTLGACSMVYGFASTNVPSFVNYARSFGQTSEVPVEMAIKMQERMFARRGVTQRPADIQLLRDVFELTRPERDALGPLSTEPLSL